MYKVGAVYDPSSNAIRDGLSWNGPRVVTFATILKYKLFPLADLLQDLLKMGESTFGSPVEIEFAVNLKEGRGKALFALLQIRPFATGFIDSLHAEILIQSDEYTLAYSTRALGNGVFNNIQEIILVDPKKFDRLNTGEIASEIKQVNEIMVQEQKPYLLIGFGRWGSKDPHLGIPITNWIDISGAGAIIEAGLSDFDIDPSFGSHFFANISSLNIPYLTITPRSNEDQISWELITQPNDISTSKRVSEHLIRISYHSPLEIVVDGRTRKGVVKIPRSHDKLSPEEE